MKELEKYRLVVRHGEYDHRNGSLTDYGAEDVANSTRDLAYVLGENAPETTLVSSPARRAVETAELIAEELRIDTDANEILIESFLSDTSPEVLTRDEMVARIVKRMGGRAVGSPDKFIVVTHLPQVIEFANLGYLARPGHGEFYRIAEDETSS